MKRHLMALAAATTLISTVAAAQDTAQVYRSFNGRQHYLSTSRSEGQRYGYRLEGAVFKVYTSDDGSDLRPLWKCIYTPQNQQFISMDRNCEGWQRQGRLGYVATQAYPGHAALWRFYYSSGVWQDHLTTTDYDEGYRAGYYSPGLLGYAPTF